MGHVCLLAASQKVSGDRGRLLMLSPTSTYSNRIWTEAHDHQNLIGRMQELRGRIYLQDNAIRSWQLEDGRHQMEADPHSWHVLFQDACGSIKGCVHARLHHPTGDFSDFALSRSALATDPDLGETLYGALQAEVRMAQELQIPLLEVGGLALDESLRGSPAILQMVFAVYGLARTLGGAIGISTVTTRHRASCVLRKLGGRSLEHNGREILPYFDPQYRCTMEVLKFYSWDHGARHESRFSAIEKQFLQEIPPTILGQWRRPGEFGLASALAN